MGLAWQQGPLAPGAIGTFLVAQPLPERLLYAEPLRRRMRVRFGGDVDRPERRRGDPARAGALPGGVLPQRGHRRRRAAPTASAPPSTRSSAPPPGTRCATAITRRRAARGSTLELPAFAEHPRRAGRLRVARDGRVLRGGRADPRSRRRRVSPHRHPPDLAPPRRARGRRGGGRDPPAAGPLRVRVRAPLVRAPRGRRRAAAHPGVAPDVLPLQGPVRLLRHRRRSDGRPGPTATPTARSTASTISSPSSPTRSRSPSTASGSSSRPGSRSCRTGPTAGSRPTRRSPRPCPEPGSPSVADGPRKVEVVVRVHLRPDALEPRAVLRVVGVLPVG